jgi:hypothetical protein
MEEIWKPIINYEGLYEISNYGRIKRFNKDKRYKLFKILKYKKNRSRYGYLQTSLYKGGICKYFYISRLVLETFIGPCPEGMEACHNDGDPSNNFVGNLRWDTHKNNEKDKILHNTIVNGSKILWAKLSGTDIPKIRKMHKDGISTKEIANIYNVSLGAIKGIIYNRNWKHI